MRASTSSAPPGRRDLARKAPLDSASLATVCGVSAAGLFVNCVAVLGLPDVSIAIAKTLVVMGCIALAALIGIGLGERSVEPP
jgi:hypothetical protein